MHLRLLPLRLWNRWLQLFSASTNPYLATEASMQKYDSGTEQDCGHRTTKWLESTTQVFQVEEAATRAKSVARARS